MERRATWQEMLFFDMAIAMALTTVVALMTYYDQYYGIMLFAGSPIFFGFLVALLHGIIWDSSEAEITRACTLGIAGVLVLASVAMLFLAVEGLVCIAMAAPLVVVMALCGTVLGLALLFLIRWRPGRVASLILAALLFAGAYPLHKIYAESGSLLSVTTSLDIAAPPEVVWENVVTFSEIDEPTEWLFKTGIAYPIRARIVGEGVGAVRYCEFTTGPFVEPITVWDPPYHLAFSVTSNPAPMKETSPWGELHPPHLDNFMQSDRGEFRLERLPDGSTRLHGTTWYNHGLGPNWYWQRFSDYIIHRIHLRVLEHIKRNAEAEHAGEEN